MPENSGECVIEFNPSLSSLQIAVGDTLVVAGENVAPEEKLAVNELTVVGRVESSCYFSIEKERSTVGNGSVALIVYVADRDFAYEVYTDLLILVEGAEEEDCFSDRYAEIVGAVSDALEAIRPEREQARYAEIVAEAQNTLEDARAEYLSERADAEAELDRAAADLDDARRQLDDGQADYAAGLRELNDAKAAYEREIADAEAELNNSQKALDDQRAQLDAMRRCLTRQRWSGWRPRSLPPRRRSMQDGMRWPPKKLRHRHSLPALNRNWPTQRPSWTTVSGNMPRG